MAMGSMAERAVFDEKRPRIAANLDAHPSYGKAGESQSIEPEEAPNGFAGLRPKRRRGLIVGGSNLRKDAAHLALIGDEIERKLHGRPHVASTLAGQDSFGDGARFLLPLSSPGFRHRAAFLVIALAHTSIDNAWK